MANLGNPGNTIEILQKYKFNFQKKYGQNFLIDTHVLDKIIKESGVNKEEISINEQPDIEKVQLNRKIIVKHKLMSFFV